MSDRGYVVLVERVRNGTIYPLTVWVHAIDGKHPVQISVSEDNVVFERLPQKFDTRMPLSGSWKVLA